MPRRLHSRPADWPQVAARLDELIGAHSGEDAFEEGLKLLVAKWAQESGWDEKASPNGAVGGDDDVSDPVERTDRRLDAARRRWPGVLAPDARTRLDAPTLRRCEAVLDHLPLLDAELFGLDAAFEILVNRAAKGQKGQFFTPRPIVSELVRMLAPRVGERVVDPACGSGGFLRHALAESPDCEVFGFDQDPRAERVARIMMAASGRDPDRIQRLDSLRRGPGVEIDTLEDRHARVSGRPFAPFDVVLTNPPFAGDVGDTYRATYQLAQLGRAERDVLFVERCLELLRPGGRYAIVLPQNKVGGAAWAHVRRYLLERSHVVAVLGLARHTFQPHTAQKTSVVVGVKRAEKTAVAGDDEVLFFICDRAGKDARGRLTLDAAGRTDCDLHEATPRVRARLAAWE